MMKLPIYHLLTFVIKESTYLHVLYRSILLFQRYLYHFFPNQIFTIILINPSSPHTHTQSVLYACVGIKHQPATPLAPTSLGAKKLNGNEQVAASSAVDIAKSVQPYTASGDWMISKMALSETQRRSLLTLTAQHNVWCEDTTKFIARYGDCISADDDLDGTESSHSDSKIRKTEAALEERLRALLDDMEAIVDGVLGPKSECGIFLSKRCKDCPSPWVVTAESPVGQTRLVSDPQKGTRPASPISSTSRSRSDSTTSMKKVEKVEKVEKVLKKSDPSQKRGSGINLIPPVNVPTVTAVTVIPVQPHFQLFIDPTFASLPWEGLPLIEGCSGGNFCL